jgi:adenylate kinase
MTRVVVLTGTPGTGKTTVGRLLGKSGWDVLELNREIVKNRLYSSRDVRRDTFVADMTAVRSFVRKETKTGKWIVVSHLAHLLPTSTVSTVVVLRCQPDKLRTRLRRKGWSAAKVEENVEAELISLISAEARQKHKKVYEIDTTDNKPANVVKAMEKVLKGRGEIYRTPVEWLR